MQIIMKTKFESFAVWIKRCHGAAKLGFTRGRVHEIISNLQTSTMSSFLHRANLLNFILIQENCINQTKEHKWKKIISGEQMFENKISYRCSKPPRKLPDCMFPQTFYSQKQTISFPRIFWHFLTLLIGHSAAIICNYLGLNSQYENLLNRAGEKIKTNYSVGRKWSK